MRASLCSSHHGRPVIESLTDVRFLKIDRGGILIRGIERVHAHDNQLGVSLQPFPQVWWCVPEPWQDGVKAPQTAAP
uniref:Uncharacterized protein n=1 Tax=biofilter metagenome TaxID=1070537 RepID=A0A193SBP5_9ZZZZ